MTELESIIWVEKYRPHGWDDLIFDKKEVIQALLAKPSMPSIILASNSPGTGKTSLAKLIIQEIGCDALVLNSSLDRSIEIIRDRVSHFARCTSSVPGVKRCVFMDEADGILKAAQESLRNLMEEYSGNTFFIFTANDKNKIIDPIRSRCQLFEFGKPSKAEIMVRLDQICDAESLVIPPETLEKLVDKHYPDLRKMISALQMVGIKGLESLDNDTEYFLRFLGYLKSKNVKAMGDTIYSGDFDLIGFNTWYFHHLYETYQGDFDHTLQIGLKLAEVEKYSNLNVNLELIAMANYLSIAKLL